MSSVLLNLDENVSLDFKSTYRWCACLRRLLLTNHGRLLSDFDRLKLRSLNRQVAHHVCNTCSLCVMIRMDVQWGLEVIISQNDVKLKFNAIRYKCDLPEVVRQR